MKRFRWSKRRFAIGFYLLSGWTVWGVNLRGGDRAEAPRLTFDEGRWVMCCGHVLHAPEVKLWKAAGFLVDGPQTAWMTRPSLVAGPRLSLEISNAWQGLLARTWDGPGADAARWLQADMAKAGAPSSSDELAA